MRKKGCNHGKNWKKHNKKRNTPRHVKRTVKPETAVKFPAVTAETQERKKVSANRVKKDLLIAGEGKDLKPSACVPAFIIVMLVAVLQLAAGVKPGVAALCLVAGMRLFCVTVEKIKLPSPVYIVYGSAMIIVTIGPEKIREVLEVIEHVVWNGNAIA